MDWKKVNNIVAAAVLVFTTIIYTLTVAPTVSFWDCGEFIATSFKMSVPHPPGSPLFLLVGRFFTLIPFADDIAFRVNMISVLSSAFTIMLLYLSIVHLIREWKQKLETKEDWLIAIFSGVIGSLTFAFTHSFWFNAAEAEVYAASMLFTAILIWLSLVWAEKSKEPGNEKYLLMISYMIGLAIAVHLLNVLALPFVAMVYYYKRYEYNFQTFMIMVLVTVVTILLIYPGIVKYLPLVAKLGVFWLFALLAGILALTYWAVTQKRHLLSFIMLSITFILIGYTSYSTVYIRSGLNPNIDENNPETVENFLKYINREQYGEHSITDRNKSLQNSPNKNQYDSVSDFFWNYQVNYMYIRYFLWQFVGMDEDSGNWNWEFFGLPLLLGMIGIVYHFRGDPKHALAVLALFFATGLAIILYLNQPDPQPRDRDYSYVGSFFAYAIWVGLGYFGIVQAIQEAVAGKSEKIKAIGVPVMATIFAVLMLVSPIQLLAKNFHSHNRSGNFVAWDYSYNILMSCEKDGILFTNGDNDTFPLWYLQEVEGIRTDIRIVNLSLLNTDWYIEQLRDMEPIVPMHINDNFLKQVQPIPWQKQEVSLQVPASVSDNAYNEFSQHFGRVQINKPKEIKFEVAPTISAGSYQLLRTQDYMILNILAANRWKKPVYFATTVPLSNLVGGLQDYLRMEGLVLKVVPFKDWRINPEKLEENLLEKYQYRFQDPNVYYNPQIMGLVQNYRTAYVQLCEYYSRTLDNREKLVSTLDAMEKNMPEKIIPWTSRPLKYYRDAFMVQVDTSYISSLIKSEDARGFKTIGRNLMGLGEYKSASVLIEQAYNLNPADPENVGMLVQAYEFSGNVKKAAEVLSGWVEKNPQDGSARQMLLRLKNRIE